MKKEWVKFAMVNIVVGALVIQMPLSVRANEKKQEIKILQEQNSENGRMEIGLVDDYYFDENGIAMTGWQQIDGNWYYFDQDSLKMYKGASCIIQI